METEIVPLGEEVASCSILSRRVSLRTMTDEQFIETHASGTLRKNRRIGMAWREQYLEERIAYEFGCGFRSLPRSRVVFGDAYTEGDCHPITEAGWFIERYLSLLLFPEDRFETKYIQAEERSGVRREGVGIIVRQTSAQFLPRGHVLFAIVAEFDLARKVFLSAINPH